MKGGFGKGGDSTPTQATGQRRFSRALTPQNSAQRFYFFRPREYLPLPRFSELLEPSKQRAGERACSPGAPRSTCARAGGRAGKHASRRMRGSPPPRAASERWRMYRCEGLMLPFLHGERACTPAPASAACTLRPARVAAVSRARTRTHRHGAVTFTPPEGHEMKDHHRDLPRHYHLLFLRRHLRLARTKALARRCRRCHARSARHPVLRGPTPPSPAIFPPEFSRSRLSPSRADFLPPSSSSLSLFAANTFLFFIRDATLVTAR